MTTNREQLELLIPTMQKFADDCDVKDGGPTADDVEKLNKMGADVQNLVAAVKAAATASGTLNVAQAFLSDLAGTGGTTEAKSAEVHTSGIVNPKGMTLGEAFSKSPAYSEFVSQFKGSDGNIRGVAGIKSAEFQTGTFGSKGLISGSIDTSGGAFVINDRYQPVVDLIGERTLTVRDLCTNVTTQSDTFEFVTVTAKTNAAAAVVEASSAADSAVYGTPTASNVQGYKPESDMTLAVVATPVQTIAHMIPITRRAAADAPQVRQLVDAFLLYGLREREEDQILNGNGTSPNLRGILQTSGISTVGSAGTDLDAIVDAIRTIRGNRRNPTALVIHPDDWYSTGFLLAKDSNGNYLIGSPASPLDSVQALWGLRVVVTPALPVNTALVGDFAQAVVADREQSAVYVTDSHKDWFQRNLLAILAEERLALGVLDAEAFCTVTAV